MSGGIATTFHYLIMLLAMNAGLSPWISTGLGALVGAAANYMLQYRFTFGSRRNHTAAFARYAVVVAFSWLLNLSLFVLLQSGLAAHIYAAQLLTTLAVTLFNYLGFKRYVFL